MEKTWMSGMADTVGEGKWVSDQAVVEKLSKDYYWYSPVLESKLKGKLADGVVKADCEDDVAKVLAYAYREGIPVTPRGAGTGNYGQAVPLEGGIVLDLSGLNRIVEIGDGWARCQCGVKLGTLEKALAASGQELRIYPSTLMVATIGGFVSGGSGGIGSITWGNLWDGNVTEATIYTLEETPRRLRVDGPALHEHIHSYGTTGIVTEVVFLTAPITQWQESIAQFDTLEEAVRFSDAIARDESVRKRMVSVSEWPLPGYFTPLKKHLAPGRSAVLVETEAGNLPVVKKLAAASGGEVAYAKEPEQYRKGVGLTDFTWNHTTLWSLRADPSLTYLQTGFSLKDLMAQVEDIKRTFGDEVLIHLEWMRSAGALLPVGLPIIRYTTEERLREIVAYLKSIGVSLSDPHSWEVSPNSGSHGAMIVRKRANDPRGLLNPGKLSAAGE